MRIGIGLKIYSESMCGINGIVSKKLRGKEAIIKMNKAIKHRGPDDEGIYVDSVALGHVRLAILDVSEKGKQPMGFSIDRDSITHNLDKADYIVVFNGEIYNFKELIEKYNFKQDTGTDTEVILRMYHLKGFDSVKEFNGMWAFCIYDKVKNLLFCSRDRLGKKPLYYFYDSDEFVFSSEIKGILAIKKANIKENLWKEALELYFSLGFIPSPYTPFRNVYKLPAAHNMVYDITLAKIKNIWRYWDIPKFKPLKDKRRLTEDFLNLLDDSIKIRLRSDVPLGLFLSGGLDSTLIAYKTPSHLNSFSVGFKDKRYDETDNILKIIRIFDLNHHHYYLESQDIEKLIQDAIEVFDEPYGYSSVIPYLFISKKAKHYVSVVLTGDGGDELFGGYNVYVQAKWISIIKKIPKFLRYSLWRIMPSYWKFYYIKEGLRLSLVENDRIWVEAYKDRMYKPKVLEEWSIKGMNNALKLSHGELVEGLRIFDVLYRTLGDNYLMKVDRASMKYALEVRSPLLDYRLVEFSQKEPTEYKVDFFKGKKFIRAVLKEILPRSVVKGKKKGFSIGFDTYLLKKGIIEDMHKKLDVLKVISEDLYKFYKNKVLPSPKDRFNKVYLERLFFFIKWYERWVE